MLYWIQNVSPNGMCMICEKGEKNLMGAINFDEQQVNRKCYDRTQQKHFVIKEFGTTIFLPW